MIANGVVGPVLAGYRNVLLIESFMLFSLATLLIVKPPSGYTAELLYAVGSFVLMVGGVVVAGITARAANKVADKWEPGAFQRVPVNLPKSGG